MRASTSESRLLEERFPHLVHKVEDGGARSFRSTVGRKVFSIEADGKRLRLPVARKVLDDLFGEIPFPVESIGEESLIPLQEVGDPEVLFTLIEALEEQAGLALPEGPAASSDSPTRRSAGGRRRVPTRLIRILLTALALLLFLFLAFSWKLAQRSLDQEREQWIETLLRR